jgi:hypothetical protein
MRNSQEFSLTCQAVVQLYSGWPTFAHLLIATGEFGENPLSTSKGQKIKKLRMQNLVLYIGVSDAHLKELQNNLCLVKVRLFLTELEAFPLIKFKYFFLKKLLVTFLLLIAGQWHFNRNFLTICLILWC